MLPPRTVVRWEGETRRALLPRGGSERTEVRDDHAFRASWSWQCRASTCLCMICLGQSACGQIRSTGPGGSTLESLGIRTTEVVPCLYALVSFYGLHVLGDRGSLTRTFIFIFSRVQRARRSRSVSCHTPDPVEERYVTD